MLVQAPTFPLDEPAFRRALRSGHGRAVLHVEQNGGAGLEAALVEAAVRSPAYDEQVEDSRSPWIDALIVAAGVQRPVLAALVDTVSQDARGARPEDTHWDRKHRAALVHAFAERGSDEARELLPACVMRNADSSDVTGWMELIALDGAAGLLFVARKLGRWLDEDPRFSVHDGPLLALDELLGDGAARAVLEAAAADDADIARYVDRLEHPQPGPHFVIDPDVLPFTLSREAAQKSILERRSAMQAVSAAEFVARVRQGPDGRRGVAIPVWAKVADEAAIEELFAALLEEQDPECAWPFLWALGIRGLPRFDERLVAWTESASDQARFHATRALATLTHPRVRELALARLASGDASNCAVMLLHRNFVTGDFARIEGLAWPQADDDVTDRVAYDVLGLVDLHPVVEAVPSLLLVYEHSRSGNHRARAIERLLALDALPDWVGTEARHDSSERVRVLVRRRRAARRR